MSKFISSTLACLCFLSAPLAQAADVTLVREGQPQAVIHVPSSVMEANKTLPGNGTFLQRDAESKRRILRESVLDLAATLQKMSGAQIPVLQNPPGPVQAGGALPILIGSFALVKFGGITKKTAAQQGYKVVVAPDGIGLAGETDESTSYAIYELLDRLGCRWYLPGELGEVVPIKKTISLPAMNLSTAPSTEYRGVWYADDAFKRRTRQGGFLVSAGHALEGYISKAQREANPGWRATINGKPHPTRLKWSLPAVSDAVAGTIIARLDKDYTPSVSLSPDDGAEFDETDDKKLDAGDMDPSMGAISLTDRFVNFANRVAVKVTQKHPNVKFGFIAYVQYTRPPVREKLHPSLIPQIAPITYCRAHAMTDGDICPSRAQMKPIAEGWAKAATHLSYYNYMFHLAETSVPYPMMDQMSKELPVLYANSVVYWQPETMPNFESVLPGKYLSIRMSWDKTQDPAKILDEFFATYYGAAAQPMRRYWDTFDQAWAKVPEHAGCGWGYSKRFPVATLRTARSAMEEALIMASTPMEYKRVKLQEEALRQFERFMDLRQKLNDGQLSNLDLRSTEWLGSQLGLAQEYAGAYSFNKVGWTQQTVAGLYFKTHYEATYLAAAKMVKENTVLGTPMRQWKYKVDREAVGEKAPEPWSKPDLVDADWKMTDSGQDTWYSLGLEGYYGAVFYRQNVKVAAIPAGKKSFLFISATDGDAKVFVNGQHIPFKDAKGNLVDVASGYAVPLTFEVTAALQPNASNQITISTKRNFLNELGTGGLMGPVYLYRER